MFDREEWKSCKEAGLFVETASVWVRRSLYYIYIYVHILKHRIIYIQSYEYIEF